MDISVNLESNCDEKKSFCVNCTSHFMGVRPLIKSVIVSKRFVKDLKDKEKIDSIVKSILECSHLEFHELHKFEENIDRNLIFRARKGELHIVYCVDPKMRLIFLRAIPSFNEYKKFLDNRRDLRTMIERSASL